jgi:hypothetical protein
MRLPQKLPLQRGAASNQAQIASCVITGSHFVKCYGDKSTSCEVIYYPWMKHMHNIKKVFPLAMPSKCGNITGLIEQEI